MARFVAGGELGEAIKDIFAGTDVRCAVAYWGSGIASAFTPTAGSSAARIICDITRGGTSPKALVDLGAPKNNNLRHVPDLHAKVYMSHRGAVIGSANASSNGIGFDAAPGLIEAGIFVYPHDDAYSKAAIWFETLWKPSKKVGKEALDLATRRFRPGRMPERRNVRAGSLLDQIAADPDRFAEISIVLVHNPSTSKDRDRSRSAMIAAYPEEEQAILRMPDDGMFIGWNARDLARWRRSFIELWMPRDRLFCSGRRAWYFHDKTGTVMSRRYWPAVRSVVEGDFPDPAQIAVADHKTVRRLLDKHDDVLFTARELAAALDQIG
jgi:hypothetical protein